MIRQGLLPGDYVLVTRLRGQAKQSVCGGTREGGPFSRTCADGTQMQLEPRVGVGSREPVCFCVRLKGDVPVPKKSYVLLTSIFCVLPVVY